MTFNSSRYAVVLACSIIGSLAFNACDPSNNSVNEIPGFDDQDQAIEQYCDSQAVAKLSIPTGATVREVPTDYTTIQEAVDAADPGDYIYVLNGNYNEQVNTTYAGGIHIIGQNQYNVIIDANGLGSSTTAVTLATGSSLKNVTVTNATVGVDILDYGDIFRVRSVGNGSGFSLNAENRNYLTIDDYASEIVCNTVYSNSYSGMFVKEATSVLNPYLTVLISYNYINKNTGKGVDIGCGVIHITNNIVYQNGKNRGPAYGIIISNDYRNKNSLAIIEGNFIAENYSGIHINNTQAFSVRDNIISKHHIGVNVVYDHTFEPNASITRNKIYDSDGAGIDLAYVNTIRVEDNLIANTKDPGSAIISLYSRNVSMTNNTLVSGKSGINIDITNAEAEETDIFIYNNIITGMSSHGITKNSNGSPNYNWDGIIYSRNNTFWNNGDMNSSNGTLVDGNRNVDPKYNDPANDDFTLQGTSSALDTGYSYSPMFLTDLDGNARISGPQIDRGAYEAASNVALCASGQGQLQISNNRSETIDVHIYYADYNWADQAALTVSVDSMATLVETIPVGFYFVIADYQSQEDGVTLNISCDAHEEINYR
jgi:hypothetical protein